MAYTPYKEMTGRYLVDGQEFHDYAEAQKYAQEHHSVVYDKVKGKNIEPSWKKNPFGETSLKNKKEERATYMPYKSITKVQENKLTSRSVKKNFTEDYNGWTNYETWNVALWLDNDGYSDELSQTVAHMDLYEAGQTIKSIFEETYMSDAPTTGPLADILNAAMSNVNWREIVEHYQEDARVQGME